MLVITLALAATAAAFGFGYVVCSASLPGSCMYNPAIGYDRALMVAVVAIALAAIAVRQIIRARRG